MNGDYKITLPSRNQELSVPNHVKIVDQCASYLKRRLHKDLASHADTVLSPAEVKRAAAVSALQAAEEVDAATHVMKRFSSWTRLGSICLNRPITRICLPQGAEAG